MSSSARPAVLFLTHHLPWPARSGGRLREAQLLQRLSTRFDIEVVAVSKVPEFDGRHVGEATRHGIRARIFAARTGGNDKAGPLTRRHTAPAARDYLTHRLHQPMVVHVEGHYLLGLVPERIRPAVLLVEHNIESALFEQRAAQCRAPAERANLLREGARTRRDELSAWRQVHIVGAVTDEDAHAIRTAVPHADVRCLPNGADHLSTESGTLDAAQRASARLLFVGDLRYEPNLHAARLLLEDIFPLILHRCPDATLAIIGPDPPEWLVNAARHVPRMTVTGWVPDVGRWLDAAHVVVCPLTVGGGIKVKVLEALARGCAVVATPIALQGLRHLPPGAAVECSDASAIADACARLLTCTQERDRQRARAAQAARYLPSWDLAADILASAWSELAATARQPSSALRVLHIIVPQRDGAIGGADLHVLDLAAAQQQASNDRPLILAPRAPRDYLQRLSKADLEVLSPALWRLDHYRSLVDQRDIRLIHAHGYEANYLVAVMRATCPRWRQVPLVITAHGWIETTPGLRAKSRLDRFCGTLADVRIATAARHAPRLQANQGLVMVIPNGVPAPGGLHALVEARESVRESLGAPRQATIIGSVGRLSPEKRVDLLLHAAHRLAPDHPDIHVLVVGGGDQRAQLMALARRLGLSRRVTFTGLLQDVTPALIVMDVFIQPSDNEGTPRSVLEAMAHQLPVVATDVGDVAELLDHGRCGELAPPGDAGILAEAIGSLLADPARTRSLARCARSRYERHYTIEIMRCRVDEAYRSACLAHGHGPLP